MPDIDSDKTRRGNQLSSPTSRCPTDQDVSVEQPWVAYFLPATREFYWNILISLPIAILLAMGSWNFIEKPTLSLRKRLIKPPTNRSPYTPAGGLALTFASLLLLLLYGAFLATNTAVIPERFVLSGPNAPVLIATVVLAAAAGTSVKWVLSATDPSVAWNNFRTNVAMSRSERNS